MSGDVQPRKRKDKKRKKDDSTEQIPPQPQPPPANTSSDDLNIHVHKEDGTGGGICAKIVFFLLFSALAVLIGLIITEHRGLTDLDTTDQESRFSQLFEGWIDNSPSHDDGDHVASSLEDEIAESEEAHDEEEDEVEEEEASEEQETQEEEEEEVQEDEDEDDDDDEDEQNLESEEANEESEQKDEDEETAEDDEDEEEEDNVSKYAERSEEEEEADNVDEDEDNEEEAASEADQSEEKDSVEDQEQEPEDDDEAQEDGQEEAPEEKASREEEEEPIEAAATEPEENPSNSKMVVKIGVGVALLVVAHVVLVRKWKSASPPPVTPEQEAPTPDLSRRNTIVVPPTYQEVAGDIEDNVDEEYSDEDGEVESDEEKVQVKSAKRKYQELRTTYTRSLTPESEPEYQNKTTDEDEYEEDDEEDVEEEEEEDDEESDGGEYDREDDDEELLKRLEVKYGKLHGQNQKSQKQDDFDDEQFSSWKRVNVRQGNEPTESDSDKQSDAETYEYENITNKEDLKIKEQLDEAQKAIPNNAAYAIKLFDVLLQNYSSSPRSFYGKAQALDLLADQKRSNTILQKAVAFYLQLLDLEDVPNALFEAAAERCIDRLRFIGNYNRAIDVHQKLIARFPEHPKYKNQLVISYLTINRVNKARVVLEEILAQHPNDGLALVHYGFILKTVDNKLHDSISYLRRGIATKISGVIDGRFYFHLGDALARLGQTEEAMKVYEEGVQYNLFLSKYQRSLYNVARLKGQPWWTKAETPYKSLFLALQNNWKKIRDEGTSLLNKKGYFQNESENLKDTGDWKQLELFARGQKNTENCKKCPFTCSIIESIPDAGGCKRGQTKFSVMHPGTHVWPHCGPTNCRLRVHLGLHVPENTYIRVANEIRSWKNGEILIFDDSFEHEVWHNGTTFRLVLIVDVWHPELTAAEKRSLSPI